jgi:eukaryotic-like serine/threonine-protein kinase
LLSQVGPIASLSEFRAMHSNPHSNWINSAASLMPLSAGDKLGPYEIVTSIGAGGMGEVYRARDPRMGREVAIKLSGERFSDRFSREVHAVAALNHPNICHLYDVGPDYLVMELVEGSTLEQRIKHGALPLDEALRIARQIAAALEAAHDKGIVHRDLKPANVILKPDGSLKVLDFGLAQVGPGTPPGDERDLERSPTISMRATQAGVILGTAAYMAPEQARGELVDKRADIWAFGVVLYEMLAGQRIYDGKTVSDILAAVLIREPDLSRVPPQVRPLLRVCLEKDPKKRLRDVGDFEFLLIGPEPAPSQALSTRRFGLIGWIAAALLLIAAAIGYLRVKSQGKEAPGLALTIVPPAGMQLEPVGGLRASPEISPDGSAVLYAANGGLYIRRLDSFNATLVPGSEVATNAPFWSADSASVFYPGLGAGGLIKVRVPDGAPEMVLQLPGASRGGSANANGTMLLTSSNRLLMLAPGGQAKDLDVPGLSKGAIWYPEFLPESDAFLFLFLPYDDDDTGNEIYLASLKAGKVVDPVPLLKNETAARCTPAGGGRILFVRNDHLYSQRLDLGQRKLIGDSQLVEERVGSGPGMSVDSADFSISLSGVLAWRPGGAALSQVTEFDRKGKAIGTSGPPGPVWLLRLSPDETRLLAGTSRSWLLDVGQPDPLDLGATVAWLFWSPDGTKFVASHEKKIVERSVSGSGEVRELGDAQGIAQDLSSDGKQLLSISSGSREIISQGLDGPAEQRKPKVMAAASAGESIFSPAFSPDGRWIVYASRSGDRKSGGVFVQPFPGPGLRRQIAATYGPVRWRGDGKEILYESRGGIYSVAVDTIVGELRFGAPVLLFAGVRVPAGSNISNRPLAVSRDGSRIFWPQAVEQPGSDVIQIRTRAVN